ncbi:MAG: 23S rRNA (adenine(2503)-C(2))-methyltransferase RlmN, partial [Pseudomonadota bacterium]
MTRLDTSPAAKPAASAPVDMAARDPQRGPRTGQLPVIGLDPAVFDDALGEIGVPERQRKMRREQITRWLYVQGATDFAGMTNIAKPLRDALAARLTLDRPTIVDEQISNDGTRKWLLRLAADANARNAPEIETVYIPEPGRGTLCISSQVGCTLNCTFCHTGTQPLVRNLTATEIVGQIMLARDRIGDWPDGTPVGGAAHLPTTERKITNIVLMGMGEPLYNVANVARAVDFASAGDGLSISRRRITLSTSGVVPQIGPWGEQAATMLAISLHAVRDDLRDEIVPINRKYPIAELLEACRTYPGVSNARRITFEYVMLRDVNDSLAEARELVRLLKGIPTKINLIPFNPWPGSPYTCSSWERIEAFADVVNRAGYASPIRTPRGRDIMAACGQLRSESVKLRAR